MTLYITDFLSPTMLVGRGETASIVTFRLPASSLGFWLEELENAVIVTRTHILEKIGGLPQPGDKRVFLEPGDILIVVRGRGIISDEEYFSWKRLLSGEYDERLELVLFCKGSCPVTRK